MDVKTYVGFVLPLLPLGFVLPPLAVVEESVPKLPSVTTPVFPLVRALSPFVVVEGLPPGFVVVASAALVVVGALTVVDALLPVVNPSALATEAHEAATTRAVARREAAVEADTDLALEVDMRERES